MDSGRCAPNGRWHAARPHDAVALSNLDLSACTHDAPFRKFGGSCRLYALICTVCDGRDFIVT
jgi:hypothetical protein